MARGSYVHGYDDRERTRLQDQAHTLEELLHADTAYPGGDAILEAGCGVGAQTVVLARNSPGASIIAVDVSAASIEEARAKVAAVGLANVSFQQADILALPFDAASFDTSSPASSWSTCRSPPRPWRPLSRFSSLEGR